MRSDELADDGGTGGDSPRPALGDVRTAGVALLAGDHGADEILAVLHESGARIFQVGVLCSVAELERRESSRAGGEVRPRGLARRSDELCHAHDLAYDVTVRTDEQTTTESVETIIAAMRDAGLLT